MRSYSPFSNSYHKTAVTVTVTVTGTNPAATDGPAVTLTVGDTPAATSTTPATTPATGGSNIGNFGKCSVPQIEFGVGFDNRKETSFQPVDKGKSLNGLITPRVILTIDFLVSFNHGSAQNIGIITRKNI